ncbi:MAG TPA: phenylalanine--tRNA ligase beta subunit-related protein [Longimicrobium sp.]|nr:phenylalanine--tRNA ligase beta subunit-related protein [Longimicrobium sp.]
MAFRIHPEVWEALPGMRLVVVLAEGLDNRSPAPGVRALQAAAADRLRTGWPYPNAQSHPHVAAWRDVYKRLGISVKKHPSAIEALVRRVLGGGSLPALNPLVDLYNTISLRHVVPAGGWDADELTGGTIELGFTAGGEPFRALGEEETATVGASELAYRDSEELVTRHFVWRQSEKAKVTPETRRAFLVSEILEPVGAEVAERVRRDLAGEIEARLGATVSSACLDPGTGVWSW